jgi:hypothetical protein
MPPTHMERKIQVRNILQFEATESNREIDFRIITSNKFDLQLCRRNTCHAFLIIFFKASKDNKNLKETKRI